MEAELAVLEDKVNQLASVCRALRSENRILRQNLLLAQQRNQQLESKLDGAKDKVAAIIAKLPEDQHE